MLSDEMTTGSVTTSETDKRVYASRSHVWNVQQRRFREAFPEVSTTFCVVMAMSPPDIASKVYYDMTDNLAIDWRWKFPIYPCRLCRPLYLIGLIDYSTARHRADPCRTWGRKNVAYQTQRHQNLLTRLHPRRASLQLSRSRQDWGPKLRWPCPRP